MKGIHITTLAKQIYFSPCINFKDIVDSATTRIVLVANDIKIIKEDWQQSQHCAKGEIEKAHKYARKIVNLMTIMKLMYWGWC